MLDTKAKNSDIQILRAIACIAVVIQHINNRLPTPPWYSSIFNHALFWSGVDIFFAISGFLICKTFCKDLLTHQYKSDAFYSFWKRRAARLFPAVLFWVTVSILISMVTTSYPNTDPVLVTKSALAGILGASNMYWASCIKFSLACGSADYNAVTWTLSLEWQLYALTTCLIVLFGFKRYLFIMAIIAIAISTLDAPNFSFPAIFRPQAFLIGSVIYFLTQRRTIDRNPVMSVSALLSGLLICFLAPLHVPQPYMFPVISLGAGLCLASAMGGTSLTSFLPSTLFSWIGERSYSIYLCHLPILLLVRELMVSLGIYAPSILNFSVALTIALTLIGIASSLSYQYIELPMQKRMAPRREVSA